MKIAYDYEIFWKQKKFGGISRYFYNLIYYSYNHNVIPNIKVFAQFYFNECLKELPHNLVEGKKINSLPPYSGKIFEFYTKYISNKKLLKFSPDIVHRTLFSNNFPIKEKSRIVITVYDLIHEILFDQRKLKPKQKAINQADKIICISNNTKNDLINIYNVNPDKVSVTYLGYEHMNVQSKFAENFSEKLTVPYILFVGSRKRYKNFDFFLNSFSKSKKLMSDFNVVLFGGEEILGEEKKKFENLNFKKNQIIHIKGDDLVLKNLYKNAKAHIFPSLYEGFGLPLIESMYIGCPIICSNIKPFLEIAYKSAEFFDPKNEENLLSSIEKVVYGNEYSKMLVKKGRERVKKFSWKNCSMETNKIYQSLIK